MRIGIRILPIMLNGSMSLALALLGVGCAKNVSNLPTPRDTGRIENTQAQTRTLTVTDAAGNPVAGASVQIGMAVGAPFAGNVLTTEADGTISCPAAWTDAEPVTISASGFVRATYYAQMPGVGKYILHAQPSTQMHELTGTTGGFGDLPDDGYADVGAVFPALTRTQASMVQVSSIISSQNDQISVEGRNVNIPSNLTIPDQFQTIYFFRVELNKPTFRMDLPALGSAKIVAAHARFPFEQVVKAIQGGKTFFDVIDTFIFKEVSVQDVQISGDTQATEIDVNQIPLTPTIDFAAPQFDSNQTMLVVSLPETSGMYYVADIKSAMPGQALKLNAPANWDGRGIVVAALRRHGNTAITGAASEEYSTVTYAANQSMAADFLPIIQPPTLHGQTLSMQAPQPLSGTAPSLTYAVYSEIQPNSRGHALIKEKKVPLWEVYAQGWVSHFDLPQVADGFATAGKHRWEITYGAQPTDISVGLPGPSSLDVVTHMTRNAIDL